MLSIWGFNYSVFVPIHLIFILHHARTFWFLFLRMTFCTTYLCTVNLVTVSLSDVF